MHLVEKSLTLVQSTLVYLSTSAPLLWWRLQWKPCTNLQFLARSGWWWIWTPLAEAQAADAPGEALDKKPGRSRAAPTRPSPPLPPLPIPLGQPTIRVRSHGRRSGQQPCEGCQGYYGDVYWGQGISQLILNSPVFHFLPRIDVLLSRKGLGEEKQQDTEQWSVGEGDSTAAKLKWF